jgi:putative ABC transport system ATP-binding protein
LDTTHTVIADNVTKTVEVGENFLNVIKGITLHIARGEVLGIIGPSGSGKSTLMGLLGGLDSPTTGSVVIDGIDISEMNEGRLTDVRNEKIGFVFQAFNLVPTLTAVQNVTLPMTFSKSPPTHPNDKAVELLESLGLGHRLRHRPGQLSGGQQQRVAIARALANDPPILLCDEPTGNLDTESGKQVMAALHDIRDRLQTTIIIVTHDMRIAEQTDRIVNLEDGKITHEKQLV